MGKAVIEFKKLNDKAKVPEYAHKTDAGFDLYSTEDKSLEAGERDVFSLGIASKIPAGYCVFLKPRSGLAVKGGVHVLAGVIDEDYRGEWGVVLVNLGDKPVKISRGDKIAQGVLLLLGERETKKVDMLSKTERGEGGFGSTGK